MHLLSTDRFTLQIDQKQMYLLDELPQLIVVNPKAHTTALCYKQVVLCSMFALISAITVLRLTVTQYSSCSHSLLIYFTPKITSLCQYQLVVSGTDGELLHEHHKRDKCA